jgi:hypothetical protein
MFRAAGAAVMGKQLLDRFAETAHDEQENAPEGP